MTLISRQEVSEARLVDADGSKLQNEPRRNPWEWLVSDHMVNPFTFTEFIITEEPVDDAYPNAGCLW